MNLTTTENILRQMRPEEKEILDPEREPVLTSILKRGQKVEVYQNPLDKQSPCEGVAQLMKLNDGQVYHKDRGYENWRVRFVDTGDEADRIVAARHLVKE